MKALILVDIQNDFCPGGALAVAGGDEVIAVANKLAGEFDLVVATQDCHPANHGSFASQHDGINAGDQFELNGLPQTAWPDHCIEGTFGADFVASLDMSQTNAEFKKGTDAKIDSYSGFFDNGQRQATGLDKYLNDRNVTEVFVMGLATDYCVKFTVLDAIKLGFKTNLIVDGCRGVDLYPCDIENAIAEMKSAGATLVTSREVLKTSKTTE